RSNTRARNYRPHNFDLELVTNTNPEAQKNWQHFKDEFFVKKYRSWDSKRALFPELSINIL
ncbi:hypothetical protein NPIL_279201, partial [Nephila pilipes]